MQRLYSVPVQAVGTTKEISPGDFAISRIAVDNPSQCWLYLSIVNTFIPPQTLGWVVPIQPSQWFVNLGFVDAPVGGIPSAVTGGPITVTVYDSVGFAVTGTDFGLLPAVIDLEAELETTNTKLDTLNASIVSLQAAIDNLRGGWGTNTAPDNAIVNDVAGFADGSNNTILVVAANQRVVVTSIQFTWRSPSLEPMRGMTYVRAEVDGFVFADSDLTPDTPTSPHFVFPPRAIVGGAGSDVIWSALTVLDNQGQNIYATMTYYLIDA